MASLVKIGHIFLNLDRILSIEDLYASTKQDKMEVRFDVGQSVEFEGREADDLRTWLNSRAINLHEATDLDTSG